jgi:cyanophycin synthetase
LDEKNPQLIAHCEKGGIAAVYEHGYVTIMKGTWKIRVDKVTNIPITFGGKAAFNIANVLPAMLATYLSDFKIEDIRLALQTFVPSPAQTPGRMNIFHFKQFAVMADYAHNAHGMEAIGKFVDKIEATKKVGVIAGVGDRRDEDTIALGAEAAKVFDEIVIRQDKNLRGKTEEEIIALLTTGIHSVKKDIKITSIKTEKEAIDYVIRNASPGSFIVIIHDVVATALDQIQALKELEDSGTSSIDGLNDWVI